MVNADLKRGLTYQPVDQRGVLVVGGDVDAQVVHVDGVLLPHAVKQHHHPDVVVDAHRNVGLLHDGDLHAEAPRKTLGDDVRGRR